MKIYHPEGSSTTLMVTPGALHPDVSDWVGDKGNPLRFDVVFKDGIAIVDSKLGDWIIQMGYANRTGLKRVFRRLIAA